MDLPGGDKLSCSVADGHLSTKTSVIGCRASMPSGYVNPRSKHGAQLRWVSSLATADELSAMPC